MLLLLRQWLWVECVVGRVGRLAVSASAIAMEGATVHLARQSDVGHTGGIVRRWGTRRKSLAFARWVAIRAILGRGRRLQRRVRAWRVLRLRL